MSWRKGSTASIETSGGSNGSRGGGQPTKGVYPFALVLRLRVVQIVCGIAAVVMGSVAAIEERHNFNLSLGVPAGSLTVLAAAWSIHRSVHRNAAGRRGGTWIARILWFIACSMHITLLVLSLRTIVRRHQHGDSITSDTSLWVATVQMMLAASVLLAVIMGLRLRMIHGPPPTSGPTRPDRCQRSTSHTGVSMVPLASTYGGLCAPNNADNVNKTADNNANDTTENNENKTNNAIITAKSQTDVADNEKFVNGGEDHSSTTKQNPLGKLLCENENSALNGNNAAAKTENHRDKKCLI